MPFPFDPSPATLWSVTDDEKLASCEVRFVPIGVKGTVMRNGKLLDARTFPTGDEALEWANEEHRTLLAQDWRETREET